jgi:hypothetical protein
MLTGRSLHARANNSSRKPAENNRRLRACGSCLARYSGKRVLHSPANLVALIRLLVALSTLGYSAWRHKVSEDYRPLRTARVQHVANH